MTQPQRDDELSPEAQEALRILRTAGFRILERQPWYRKAANTVTAGTAALVALAGTAVAAGLDLPESVQWVVLGAILLGGVFGVNKTPNGYTPEMTDKIEHEVINRFRPLE